MSTDAGSVVGSGFGGGGGDELPEAGPGDDVELPLHAATSTKARAARCFMGPTVRDQRRRAIAPRIRSVKPP